MLPEYSTYTSVRSLPDLVGRESELEQISDAIRDTANSYIIYVTGAGGLGKTRLVQHVLKNLPVGVDVIKASDLIDLYHTQTHSLAGLVGEILNLAEPLNAFFKSEIEHGAGDKLKPVVMAEQEGFTQAEVITRRRELTAHFLEMLNRFTSRKRLVLALDTAERLHQSDYAQQILNLAERPVILDWLLKEFLPSVGNTVVLIAGRPGPGNMRQALEQVSNKRVITIDLPGLTEECALEYFEAVARKTATSDDPRDRSVSERICGLSREQRQTAFYCLCETHNSVRTVRPILLALAIDHLAVEGEPLPAFSMPLAEAKALDDTRRREIQEELGKTLVNAIQHNRHPSDEVIKALAWLGKGGDIELLSRLSELDVEAVEKALDNIRDLSFVKIRPGDKRVFLHDEVFDLIRRRAAVSEPRRERVYQIIFDYYKKRIEDARKRIGELYEPAAEMALPHPAEVIKARTQLQSALVEDLHYRLLHQQAVGFETYFRYAEEAISANDESLDMQLRAELLGFLERHDPTGKMEEIHGLRRADVSADAAVRWVKRLVERDKYQPALDIARKLHAEAKGLLEQGGALAQADLDTWQGLALTYCNSFDQAEPLLEKAVRTLEGMPSGKSPYRWNGILARAYNNLGYFARERGQIPRAAQAYRDALPHWRYLGMKSEHANTLNNLAYVLALQGKFAEARRQGMDALKLREEVGPRAPVVLSLTALAEIEIYAGHYEEANAYAERGLALAQILDFARGEGFAHLALATLNRFQAEPEQHRSVQERQRLLQQSLEHSQKALQIFTEMVDEPTRATKARYEQALTLREQCRLLNESDPQRANIAQQADALFNQAAIEAKKQKRWDNYLDACLGQIWMHYHLKDTDLNQSLRKIWQEIQTELSDYLITSTRWPGVLPSTVLGIFSQLARFHIISGILALDKNNRREAGQQFALGFEYDRFIGEDFRDLNRGVNVVHNRLRGFNPREMVELFDGVASVLGSLMSQGGPGRLERKEDLLFWQVLESHFGSYEVLRQQIR